MPIYTNDEIKETLRPAVESVKNNDLAQFTSETDSQFAETQERLQITHNLAGELQTFQDNLQDSRTFREMQEIMHEPDAVASGKVQILRVEGYVPMYKQVIHRHEDGDDIQTEDVVVFKKPHEEKYLMDEQTHQPVTFNLELWQARVHVDPPEGQVSEDRPDMSFAPLVDGKVGLKGVVAIIEKDITKDESIKSEGQEDKVEAPLPTAHIQVDSNAAQEWVDTESDPALRKLRQAIIDRIDCVSFDTFKDALNSTARRLKTHLEGIDYGIIWDYKPHSSKRWVTELVEGELEENPPSAESYYTPTWERLNGNPTIESMVDQGINTFVVLDDAIYSGEQIINRAILPIIKHSLSKEFLEKHPNTRLKLVVAAPYMTNQFLENSIVKQAVEQGFVDIVEPEHIMLSLKESLGEVELSTLEQNGGKLSPDDPEVFYLAPTTCFDHRVPDGHSFPDEIRSVFTNIPEKPYDQQDSEYYQREENDFDRYKSQFPLGGSS